MTTEPLRPPGRPVPPQWLVGRGVPDLPADADAICLIFSRSEVTALRVGRAADDLMHLSEDEQRRRRLVHGLTFSFVGWDYDPRPIHQIPECRRYLQALNSQWRDWLHFLVPDPALWATLLLSLLSSRALPVMPATASPRGAAYALDSEQLREILTAMVSPLQMLHAQMGLTAAQSDAVFQRSLGAIQGATAA
jgi:hypothetical protein